MTDARLQFRPELPLCWEDPHTIRLGFDRAIARLERPSAGAQRLLSALRVGIRPADLTTTAFALGVSAADLDDILDALAPALVEVQGGRGNPPADRPLLLEVEHRGPPPRDLLTMLTASGCELIDHSERETRAADLIVVVERYLEPLGSAVRRHRAEAPRLLIRFTDRSLIIGPLAATAGRPCLDCVSLSEVDRDPGLPALAAQLIDAVPATETRSASEAAAVIALALARRWRTGESDVHCSRIRIPVRSGALAGLPVLEAVTEHPACSCGWIDAHAGKPQ